MDRKSRNRKWTMTILYLLAGVYWCLVAFSRTNNRLVQGTTVVLWLAVAVSRITLTRKATAGEPSEHSPALDRAIAIVFCAGGAIYLWGAHPPNAWFFGVPGAILIFTGFLLALIVSTKIRPAVENTRQQKRI
jgi:hypothetical protein